MKEKNMGMGRRNFLIMAGTAALGSRSLFGGALRQRKEQKPFDPLNEQGIHPILEKAVPYIFIDACMQIWPDARFEEAHRYGATVFAVTAWTPHLPVEQALEEIMYWHLVARKHPGLAVACSAGDIREARKDGKSLLMLASQCGDFIGYKLFSFFDKIIF